MVGIPKPPGDLPGHGPSPYKDPVPAHLNQMIFPSSRDRWGYVSSFPCRVSSLTSIWSPPMTQELYTTTHWERGRFPHASMEPTSNMARFDNQSKQVSGWWRWTKSSTSYQKSSGRFMNHSLLAKLEEDQLKKWIKLRGIYCVSQMVLLSWTSTKLSNSFRNVQVCKVWAYFQS